MSSSSSDSDSDDCEPIRRIRINIRPKDEIVKQPGADINEIKASVESWRPLGPPVHPSLTRRLSSLSSMTSASFGSGSVHGISASSQAPNTQNNFGMQQTSSSRNSNNNSYHAYGSNAMRSSPSCSSLVNEFNIRSTFSNFMSNNSRTTSPLTLFGQQHQQQTNFGSNTLNDSSVPIAIAIQESIELTVKGGRQTKQTKSTETRFEMRALGNIKVAFPNSFARLGDTIATSPVLKLRIHKTENILRYYASSLIKDLDSETSSLAESSILSESDATNTSNMSGGINVAKQNNQGDEGFLTNDLFNLPESPLRMPPNRTRMIEFDMEALMNQLTKMYHQAPNSRYYNVDIMRYQIAPFDKFERCPLQVCAYWKIEPKLIKLRIDFKHSNQSSGFNLERIREVSFGVDMSNLVPDNLFIDSCETSNNLRKNLDSKNGLGTKDELDLTIRSNTGGLLAGTSKTLTRESQMIQQPLQPQESTLPRIPMQMATMRPQPKPRQSQIAATNSAVASSSFQTLDILSHASNENRERSSKSEFHFKLPPPPPSGHARGHHKVVRNSASTSKSQTDDLNALFAGVATVRAEPAIACNQPLNTSNYAALSQLITLPNDPIAVDTNSSFYRQQTDMLTGDSSSRASSVRSSSPTVTSAAVPPDSTSKDQSSPNTEDANTNPRPFVNFDPPNAHWDSEKKQLTWKFDNLLTYHKTEGFGSLLAKLDLRHHHEETSPIVDGLTKPQSFEAESSDLQPKSIEVKFMVVDSTLSKINMSIDSNGYRMSLLKREIRSGRYRSEPYVF